MMWTREGGDFSMVMSAAHGRGGPCKRLRPCGVLCVLCIVLLFGLLLLFWARGLYDDAAGWPGVGMVWTASNKG